MKKKFVTSFEEKVKEVRKLPSDEAFVKSIQRFVECINCEDARNENYLIIERQAKFVDKFIELRK